MVFGLSVGAYWFAAGAWCAFNAWAWQIYVIILSFEKHAERAAS